MLTSEQFVATCNCRYGEALEKAGTNLRFAIPAMKRLAVFLDWLASGSTYKSLADKYDISAASCTQIIHAGVTHFHATAVDDAIRVPAGDELDYVMKRFEELCHLPGVCGAVDGTFVEIAKPVEYGNMYWCYKHMYAITVLAVVDHAGCFSFVDAGMHGSAGDAAVWSQCLLRERLFAGQVYVADELDVRGTDVLPYLVADAAFALHPRVMKCFPEHEFMQRRHGTRTRCKAGRGT